MPVKKSQLFRLPCGLAGTTTLISFTTKITARLSRNQKENATFTTKVTKSTKLRSLKISRVRNLRDLRGEIVFLIQELRKDASENLRRPRQFSRIVVQSSQSSENL